MGKENVTDASIILLLRENDEKRLHSALNSLVFQTEDFNEVVLAYAPPCSFLVDAALCRYAFSSKPIRPVELSEDDLSSDIAALLLSISSEYVLIMSSLGRLHESTLELAAPVLQNNVDVALLPVAVKMADDSSWAMCGISNTRLSKEVVLSRAVSNPYWGKFWKKTLLEEWLRNHSFSMRYYSEAPLLLSRCDAVGLVKNKKEPLYSHVSSDGRLGDLSKGSLTDQIVRDDAMVDGACDEMKLPMAYCCVKRMLDYATLPCSHTESFNAAFSRRWDDFEQRNGGEFYRIKEAFAEKKDEILHRKAHIPYRVFVGTSAESAAEEIADAEAFFAPDGIEVVDLRSWAFGKGLLDLYDRSEVSRALCAVTALVEDGGIYLHADLKPQRSLGELFEDRAFVVKRTSGSMSLKAFGAEPAHPLFLGIRDSGLFDDVNDVALAGKEFTELLVGRFGMSLTGEPQLLASAVRAYSWMEFLFPVAGSSMSFAFDLSCRMEKGYRVDDGLMGEIVAYVERRNAEIASLEKKVKSQQAKIEKMDKKIADVRGSLSWKVTEPIRSLHRKIRRR